MFCNRFSVLFLLLPLPALAADRETSRPKTSTSNTYAEIRVVDDESGRGVPLVELEMVNGLTFVTDNAGLVALHEPGLMDREVFFTVRSHGYEVPKDGFGYAGVRVTPRVGTATEIKITRRNLAERLCRLTGEGQYRDTILLGYEPPLSRSPHPGNVAGQDTVQATHYRGKVYWFWGDTLRMEYPLGLFRTAGATTSLFDPNDPKSDPAAGIAYDYFVDEKSGFARAMMPLAERPEGVVWISALAVVPDDRGHTSPKRQRGVKEKLIAHYSRRKGIEGEYEQGIAIFDDEQAVFSSAQQLPLDETWRRPSGHPILFDDEGTRWLLFGSPTPNVRVPATLQAVLDPNQYQAFTCLKAGSDPARSEVQIGSDGAPVWRWQKDLPPMGSKAEQRLVASGKIKPRYARFCPADCDQPKERIVLHSGSVRWNEYRKCWVLVAGEIGGKSSHLGEVWYAEADHPTGPFAVAAHVVTHDRQTFYNVCHHAFLDRAGGRTIHFEGTYTNEFSGNPQKTPRYNYNQVLYRLDLGLPALHPAQAGK